MSNIQHTGTTAVGHIIKAATQGKQWGRDAAKRYIANRTGYNAATALRVLTVATICEACKGF